MYGRNSAIAYQKIEKSKQSLKYKIYPNNPIKSMWKLKTLVKCYFERNNIKNYENKCWKDIKTYTIKVIRTINY